MKKSQEQALRMQANDLRGLVDIKDYLYNDGPSRGTRAFDLKNGKGIEMTVLADRGLDIPAMSYKGTNLSLCSKVPVRSPYLYSEDGARGFLRQFNAGLLTTCGLTYAGAAGEDNGVMLGLHGPFDNTPAENVRAWRDYEGDDMVLNVAGDIRECRLFGDNMIMHRHTSLLTERNLIRLHDRVENLGFVESPLMLVYHINFGYPMLDEGARIYSSGKTIAARTPFAQEGMDKFNVIEAPEAGRPEQCYYHTDHAGSEGFAMLHNEKLGIAAIVRFDTAAFPLLCEWKSMAAGDYCLGLEPTTSGVVNRAEARANGMLCSLKPGEVREFNVSIEVTDDPALIREMIACDAR